MSSSTERQLKSLMHHFGVYTDDALGKALGTETKERNQEDDKHNKKHKIYCCSKKTPT